MLTQPTLDRMNAMKMFFMVDAFQRQLASTQSSALSFEERLGLLVDAEWSGREQRKLDQRLRTARLRHSASIEDVDFKAHRGLSRDLVLALGRGDWLRERQNLLITGPTGVGKSYLACAFAERACRSGFTALYLRAPRLYQELAVSRGDGSYGRLLARLTRTQLLIIDDWGLAPLKDQERRDLLEVVEDRYERASTLITSQLPIKAWHEVIGDATLADAICDRLVHCAHRLELKGPSLREAKARPAVKGAA
ncbi:MAG TPA: IS21-like element helper ATPase IstB [Methylomirabilota bacterium]|nr:IS21-like element helper ATPase IstB [Methylomirabilota bacterium]